MGDSDDRLWAKFMLAAPSAPNDWMQDMATYLKDSRNESIIARTGSGFSDDEICEFRAEAIWRYEWALAMISQLNS